MKALVIDDSKTMRRIVSRILVDFGYEVAEAADGQQALDALANAPLPDLACIDWNMPVMDGLTFVSRVRAEERLRGITLLMVTTESEYGQIVRALAAGAHEYLIKPFTPDALQEKLAILGLLPEGIGEEVPAW
jgi:two-component system chemotaxis response regulator CheY